MRCALRIAAVACTVLGLASVSSAGQVKLEIHDGRVTLDAKDATVREILTEWARVGQARVMNAERVPGSAITILLTDVPEQQALETVLRSVAGFVAVPRAVAQGNTSVFDRIMVMPASRPAVIPVSASANPVQPQQYQNPYQRAVPPPTVVVDDQDDPMPTAQMPMPGQQPAGAAQPGMMTPNPQTVQPGGSPGGVYGNPYGPNAGGGAQAAPAGPSSAARPGLPTAPPPPPPPQAIIK
jgi:hypothetical protein